MNGMIATILEYWHEGIRPRTPLSRMIVPLLAFKFAFIILLYLIFFGPSTQHDPGLSEIDADVLHLSASPLRDALP